MMIQRGEEEARQEFKRLLAWLCVVLMLSLVLMPARTWAAADEPEVLSSPDAPVPRAGPRTEIDGRLWRAQLSFEHGDYADAIQALKALLRPMVLSRDSDITVARALLGIALYVEGDAEEARQEFKRLLAHAPEHELDPFLVPPPIIELFEAVRTEVRAARGDEASLPRPVVVSETRPAAEAESVHVQQGNTRSVVERRSMLLNFFPFGLGQFQAERRAWGWFFALAQGLALTTNMAAYVAAEQERGPRGYYEGDAYGRAIRYGRLQVGAFVAFGALWVWSAVDALWKYEPERVVTTHD